VHATCWLVPDAQRRASSTLRAGHDVAGMGLLGHLDSLGPDSEVLARVLASTSRLQAGSFEVALQTGSDSRLRTACKLLLDTEVTECSEGGHSGPTTGTEIVIVAISRTCCPGSSTM
jgi:hypothetical protein